METKAFDWDELTTYRTAKPFRPFFVEFRSGEILQVLDAMWFGGIDDRIGIYDPTRDGLQRCRVSDIMSIRQMSADEVRERAHLLRKRRA